MTNVIPPDLLLLGRQWVCNNFAKLCKKLQKYVGRKSLKSIGFIVFSALHRMQFYTPCIQNRWKTICFYSIFRFHDVSLFARNCILPIFQTCTFSKPEFAKKHLFLKFFVFFGPPKWASLSIKIAFKTRLSDLNYIGLFSNNAIKPMLFLQLRCASKRRYFQRRRF